VDPVLYWLDVCGVAVFAASGALTASRKQMDLVGFVLIAVVTGIGGGTLRDLVLGAGPVFWMHEPLDLYLCTAVAMIRFFAAPPSRIAISRPAVGRCHRLGGVLRKRR
jgi:uncharacterized membrane protein YeiH